MRKIFRFNSGLGSLTCRSGFTLAEVLVTLGIIGVVSAMTIPTLMQNHQRKVYVTQLHKVYNEFQQAVTLQITERNANNIKEAGVRSDAGMKAFLQNQFKIVKDCTGNSSDCLADSYTNINGDAVTSYSDTSAPCVLLASGAAICVKYVTGGCAGDMLIDINGKQGPNVIGRDLFYTTFDNAGSFGTLCIRQADSDFKQPDLEDILWENNNTSVQKCQKARKIGEASWCFNEILNNNWEMNY